VKVEYFDRQQAVNNQPTESLARLDNCSDKPTCWSPSGTYLVVITPAKVLFLGGKDMIPIITIPQANVEAVSMSPCEKYVLTYAPKSASAFTVWDFQMVSVIRDFTDSEPGENIGTYRWSFDGQFLAKGFRTEKEGGKIKEGITVYELPSMEILRDANGRKTSVSVAGIGTWAWAPASNMLVFTQHLVSASLMDDEKPAGPDPKVTFMEIPGRTEKATKVMKGSSKLEMTFHPQGTYLGVMNQYKLKKASQYSVEIFDLTSRDDVPHQQVQINRPVQIFRAVHWEPNHAKLAVHTLSQKQSEGRREYTSNPTRDGVDIYEMVRTEGQGFVVKDIGKHQCDRVTNFSWSPAGDLFVTCEKDGPSMSAK
jgi:uncharacterized protein with WD repeat